MSILLISSGAKKEQPEVPIGLITLAAYLLASGQEIQIIDACAEGTSLEDLAPQIKAARPQIVGIDCKWTNDYLRAAEIAQLTRKAAPRAITVFGGHHATYTHQQILRKHNTVDIIVRHEGENTFAELVQAIRQQASLETIPGLTYRQNGRIHVTPNRPMIPDIDTLPMPAYHLLNMNLYGDAISIVTNRGCPYKCIYCGTNQMWGAQWRPRSAPQVVDEMALLHQKYNKPHIIIRDDVFTVNKRRVLEICKLILEKNHTFTWGITSKVNLISPDLLSAIAQANCTEIYYTVESLNQESLDLLGLKTSIEQVKNAVEWARNVGIDPICYYMLGIPGETREKAMRTIEFAKQIGRHRFNFLTPYPGCELYNRLQDYGIQFVTDDPWQLIALNPVRPVAYTRELSVPDLMRLFLLTVC